MPIKFKVGDTVKIARKVDTAHCMWVDHMDEFIGCITTIVGIYGDHDDAISMAIDAAWLYPSESLELVSNKYIDGIEVSHEEFERRTAAPIKMTWEEIEVKLGYKIELK